MGSNIFLRIDNEYFPVGTDRSLLHGARRPRHLAGARGLR
jgi:hypothetical protein